MTEMSIEARLRAEVDQAIRERDFARELLEALEKEPAAVQLNEQIVANQKLARRAHELEDVLRAAAKVVAYVSSGRGYIGVKPYPDATARKVLAQIDEAIGLEPK